MPIIGDFERFQYFKIETFFFEKIKPFKKNWSTVFQLRRLQLQVQKFAYKTALPKAILQIEW